MAIVSDVEIRLRADIARLQQDMTAARRTVETATDGMAKAIQRVKDAFATLAVGAGLGAGLSEIVKMSDTYTKYTAQLKLASASQTDYANSLAAVKRIATDAQSSLEKTGVLYARITNGTRDLGLGQQKVADITETVSLALKVSGATAEESSSAMLQLSQAFASGTLRGEEFNAVNEAAPRLMKALADGLGVPVGALKDMATQGKLTSEVLATALPKALTDLRNEGAQIQTISGAFQVLKDRVMEFTATQAQANGTVSALTTGIGVLADNLGILMNVLVTVGAAKFGSMLATWTTATYRQVTANAALGAANLTVANTQAANTAATLATTTARVAELRAAVASAEGDVALALALNGLVPAQARAAAAAAAHTAALGVQAAAARATSLAVTAGSRALGLLGGPIGAVITVLGLAATAWSFFGSKSEEANKVSTETTSASTAEVVAQLQKQIEKLNERNALFGKAPDVARGEGPGAEKQRDLLKQIDDAQKNNNLTLETKTEIVRVLTLQYGEVTNQVYKLTQAQAQNDKNMNGDKLTNWLAKNTQYLSGAEKLANTIAQARKELGDAFTPEVEKRIRESLAAPDAKKYATEVQGITKAIQERTAAAALDAQAQGQMTDGQAYALKLMEDIRNGTLKLTLADKVRVAGLLESMLAQEAANTGLAEAAKWYKKVGETAAESRAALEAEGSSVEGLSETRKQSIKILVDLQKHGAQLDDQAKEKIKLDRTQLDAMSDLNDQRKRERELQDQLLADSAQQVRAAEQQSASLEDQVKYYGLTEEAVLRLKAAELSRQLAAAGADSIEAGRLAGLLEETQRQADAQKQLTKMKADTSFWTGLEDAAHQTFLSISNGNKDLWTRMKESAKNIFFEWLYQQTLKKWIINIGLASGGAGAVSGIAGAATVAGAASNASSVTGQLSSLAGLGSLISSAGGIVTGAMQTAGALLSGTIGIGQTLGAGWGALTSGSAAGASAGIASIAGVVAPIAIGALVGSKLLGAAFGMGAKTVNSTMLSGTLTANSADVSTLQAWSQKGGWFRSNKSGTDVTSVGAAQNAAFASAYKAILDVSKTLGDVIGADTGALGTRVQQLKIDLTGLTDATKQQEAITKFFSDVADTISTELVPNLAQFQAEGETLSATLQRVVTDYATLDSALAGIGKTFGAVGVSSIAAREELIKMAGGLDALTSGVSYFQQNFFTEAEQLAPVQKQLADAMSALGLSSVTTEEQFKQTVMGLDLNTEASAALFAKLIALAPAFKQVTDAADAAKQATIDAAKSAVQSAFDALSKSVAARKNVLADAYAGVVAGLDASIQKVNESITITQQLADALKGNIVVPGSEGGSFAAGRQALADALAQAQRGVLPTAESLTDALTAVRRDNTDQFSSLLDYQRAAASANNDIEKLRGLTGNQLSIEQQQLISLQLQQEIAQAAYDAEVARLDALLASAQEAVSVSSGTNQILLTIGAALAAFGRALTGLNSINGIDYSQSSAYYGMYNPTDVQPTGANAVADAIALLTQQMTAMQASMTRTANSTQQLAQQFDAVSAGGNALITETA